MFVGNNNNMIIMTKECPVFLYGDQDLHVDLHIILSGRLLGSYSSLGGSYKI